jgi:hypothetical protein
VLPLLKKVRWLPWIVILESTLAVAVAYFWPLVSAALLGSAFILTVLEGIRAFVESTRARARNTAANPVGRGR